MSATWTPERAAELLALYPTRTVAELAEHFGCTKAAIRTKHWKSGVGAKVPAVEHDDETQRRVSFFASSNVLDVGVRDYAAWIEIEEADEAVCARIWEIFAKDSTARGFDARSARSIRASKALAARREAEGEIFADRLLPTSPAEKMAREINGRQSGAIATAVDDGVVEVRPARRGLRGLLKWDEPKEVEMTKEEFAAAHAAFKKAQGRTPTASELFEAIGPEARSLSNVRTSIKRAGLVLAGARGPRAPKAPADVGDAGRRPSRRPRPKAEAAESAAIVVRRAASSKRATDVIVADPLVADLIARRDAVSTKVSALDAAIAALTP